LDALTLIGAPPERLTQQGPKSYPNDMSSLTLELRPQEEQTAFNLRRWDEVLADSDLRKLPSRVETDRHGRIIISPPAAPVHGKMQAQVGALLKKMLPHGTTITECPVSTADGIKGVDVAWASAESWGEVGNRTCFLRAPEICVEVASPSNTEEELREKIALYFDAGAKEVWLCTTFGELSFHAPGEITLKQSALCAEFPRRIPS
jgi:Uma2 family endonuclease